MNGTVLLETLQELLPGDVIEAAANDLGVVQRERKLDITRLVACSAPQSAVRDGATILGVET
jgi:hypothetical protein